LILNSRTIAGKSKNNGEKCRIISDAFRGLVFGIVLTLIDKSKF